MTTKLISLFALCVLLGLVMLACGGGTETTNANNSNNSNNSNTAANKGATTTTTPATTASPASTAATGEKIGVAECDDFLAKYEACVSGKVPAAAQATFKSSIETWRKSWKDLAANPSTKATLTSVCKTAMDQAKTSLGSYGCTW
jgi:cytoskeletal protein RodZ